MTGRTLYLLVFLCAMISGCQDDGDAIGDQVRQIAFEIAVLDEEQREGTVFEPGTDVSFALKLINDSGKEFEWLYEYECQLFQALVYGRDEGEFDGDYILIGALFPSPMYCLMINLPPRYFPYGETIVARRPWSANPDNQPLFPGKYYVVARVELNVGGELRTWDLRTDFEMQYADLAIEKAGTMVVVPAFFIGRSIFERTIDDVHSNEIYYLQFVDKSGTTIYKAVSAKDRTIVDTQGFPSGTYIVILCVNGKPPDTKRVNITR